jgi:hypothetical protein
MLNSGGTAVAAHGGGALTGFLFAKVLRDEIGVPSWMAPLFGEKRSRRSSSGPGLLDRLKGLFGGQSGADETGSRPRPASSSDGAPAARSNNNRSKEVDRILDKISEHGYESLSDEEKKTLYEASQS